MPRQASGRGRDCGRRRLLAGDAAAIRQRGLPTSSAPTRSSRSTAVTSSPRRPVGCRSRRRAMSSILGHSEPWGRAPRTPSRPRPSSPTRWSASCSATGASGSTGWSTTPWSVSDSRSSESIGNDGVWSNIKTFHRMAYPERLVATDLGVRPYHEMVRGSAATGSSSTTPPRFAPPWNGPRHRASPPWSTSTSPRRCGCRPTTASRPAESRVGPAIPGRRGRLPRNA